MRSLPFAFVATADGLGADAVHRTYHQCEWAWKHHALHHRIRAPTPVLAILSDDVQEAGEIWILPLLTFWTCPLNFHELYLVGAYQTFVEGAGAMPRSLRARPTAHSRTGHAGIRAHWAHPLLGRILSPFGMDLAIEDHDLHHRYGRSGKNYGKRASLSFSRPSPSTDGRREIETRMWDRVFGTVDERVEGKPKATRGRERPTS